MRRCKIAVGCKNPDKPCCADCSDKTCQARCQNIPSRCKCWEESPPPKHRGPQRKVSSLQVAYLYGQLGMTPPEIARRLGCGKSTAYNILQEMGVPKRG